MSGKVRKLSWASRSLRSPSSVLIRDGVLMPSQTQTCPQLYRLASKDLGGISGKKSGIDTPVGFFILGAKSLDASRRSEALGAAVSRRGL